MKPLIPFSLLAALAACGLAFGQAYTTPVGYVSLGDYQGSNAVAAKTDVAISIPLNRSAAFVGQVASVSGNAVVISGANFEPSQWVGDPSTPYLVNVASGAENGLTGLVTSNGVDSITVSQVTSGSLASLAAGDRIEIRPAWTLISLFPAGSVPSGTRFLAYSSGTPGENISPELQYVWTGAQWQQLVGLPGGPANNTILYAGESFVVRAEVNPVNKMVVVGEVPTSYSRTDIVKLTAPTQDNRIGYFSPVEEVIGDSGLGFSSGDRLLAFSSTAPGQNKSPSEILVYNGTDWIGLFGVTGVQTSSYTLKPGQGYVYRRNLNAPQGVVDWRNEQSYNGN